MGEGEQAPASASPRRVRVWDLPTRLVHWLLVIGIGVSWWTAETGRLEWHRWSGHALLGLLTFRLYWGLLGSSTARFGQFVRGPRTVAAYLRGAWTPAAGHNPLGAWSVLALLVTLLLQIGLGLIAVDVDGIESGPLSLYVSFETGRSAAQWHETIFNVLLALIALHVIAIAWYLLVRKQNLVGAMIHGTRAYPDEVPPVQPAPAWRFIVGVVIASAFTWAVSRAFEF